MSIVLARRGTMAGKGTSVFDPTSISGLVAWFDASQISGLSDTDPVATWADLSGNSRDLSQATSGDRPVYRTNVVNGLPVVRFDGAGDKMATNSFAALAQPNQAFVVVNITSTATWQYVFDGIVSGNRHALGMGILVGGEMGMWIGNSGPSAAQSLPSGWHVWSATFNVNSSVLRKDAGAFASGGHVDATNTLTGLTVGGRWTTGETLGGDVAEVLLYDSELSTGDRDAVESYLVGKWL